MSLSYKTHHLRGSRGEDDESYFVYMRLTKESMSIVLEELKKAYEQSCKDEVAPGRIEDSFDASIKILTGSFLLLIEKNNTYLNKKQIEVRVQNPSVNDFLKMHLDQRELKRKDLLEHAYSITQYFRLIPAEQFVDCLDQLFLSGKMLTLNFPPYYTVDSMITWMVIRHQVVEQKYQKYINQYLCFLGDMNLHGKKFQDSETLIRGLMSDKLYHGYKIEEQIKKNINEPFYDEATELESFCFLLKSWLMKEPRITQKLNKNIKATLLVSFKSYVYTYIREQYYDEKARDKAYEIIYTPWEASCYVDEMCEVILKISIEHAEKVLGELTELVGLSSKKLVDTIKKNAEIMELAREEAEGFCEVFREEYDEDQNWHWSPSDSENKNSDEIDIAYIFSER